MFFSWYDRNKNFAQRKKSLGQIFPFLLIGMVGLLAVALSISGIFSEKETRTRAANAADAGSLATGSILSGAFNELCLRNKAMRDYYLLDLGYYTTLQALANGYFDEGITFSQSAEDAANSALGNIHGGSCETWTWQETAALQNYNSDGAINSAAEYALEAAKCIGAVQILTMYMQIITDNYKSNQTQNYCEANDFMYQSFKDAKSTGIRYAFNNSGISGDDFSYWLGTSDFTNGSTWPPGAAGPNGCGTTVTINLPEIKSFEVQHTRWNYPKKKSLTVHAIPCLKIESSIISDDPFNSTGTFTLREHYRAISAALIQSSVWGMEIYKATDGAHEYCCDHDPIDGSCTGNCCSVDPLPTTASDNLNKFQTCLRDALHNLNTEQANYLSMKRVKTINTSIYNNVWLLESPTFFPSKTCDDVQEYIDESEYPGLMITKLDEVKLTWADWVTDCFVISFCRSTDPNTGKTTTSSFTGYSQSEFNVDNLGILRDFLDLFDTQLRAVGLF